jgi:acyl transferase domain-containing protein/acyl carrier protein/NAD(P)-dependent dehydrogenase (short-subunit alcohol dehydrogenase family)
MENNAHRAIAIVGVGAVLPDAPNAPAFWKNVKEGRYSITDVSPERWDPNLYYNPDPTAPDKSYSKIGGWVREFSFEPMKWHMPLPPKVVAAMDEAQRWAIACTREVLEDYGYPKRSLDPDRTAVILGNAMAGEKHYLSALRISFPEYARELGRSESFAALPEKVREDITRQLHDRITSRIPDITEDSMPGELANCIAGRIANLYNFHGPNYVCDAACASAMAAISSAVEGLVEKDFDTAIVGGIDRNMGASTFVKFCKIGALSATGTRPYADGADGFVMGEGAALFLLKRLADAERDGDKTYAVIRGIGGSSDGKGKGITAPNPVGQRLAVQRGWENAGLSPASATYIEGHGTSTKVGDVVELNSIAEVLKPYNLPVGSVGIGSVKSNIGHLKGAAGAAGLLKTTFALRDKVLPPSIHCERKNPDMDFAHSPLYVNTELRPWEIPADTARCAGLSAFGFGGTNFHAVLEEYIPGRLKANGKHAVSVGDVSGAFGGATVANASTVSQSASAKAPLRGALVLGANSEAALIERLRKVLSDAQGGHAPSPAAPAESDLRAPERLAIDYADAAELADKAGKALKAMQAKQTAIWKALRPAGIFRGQGPAPKAAFLYTGQGSQYVNMLRSLRDREPIVAETFAEADTIMIPLLGRPLTSFIYVDSADEPAVAQAEQDLMQTAITQPAVLATDLALTRLLAAYGIVPDMTMGHSLGEYGALVASGGLPFADALEAVSARGREMTRVSMADNGKMAAVFAPIGEVERILATVDGFVVVANINSEQQAVIGGASKAVEQASEKLLAAGFNVVPLPVSHAFHTTIVAPASEPLRRTLERLHLQSPCVPIVANVDGQFYPTGFDAPAKMLDILAKQIASPVQFIKGLQTLYGAGARVFVEVGPKKALQGFAEDVLGKQGDVVSLFTNHPKLDDTVAFNQSLCALYSSGLGKGTVEARVEVASQPKLAAPVVLPMNTVASQSKAPSAASAASSHNGDRYSALGHLFEDFIKQASQLYRRPGDSAGAQTPVVITGAALGLPGTEHVFDDKNVARLLHGEQCIDVIPSKLRRSMLDKHITRVVKSDDGSGSFETITDVAEVIKLAGRAGVLDLEKEFGVSSERIAALDHVTCLAVGAGIDALRDAGIPLVLRYKTTSKGTQLPDRWGLPDALRDDTGVIFASAFPGYDAYAQEMANFYADRARRERLEQLQDLRSRVVANGHGGMAQDLDRRITELQAEIEQNPYLFDRRFLFRVLAMGHSQFAEYIGARGPNTQINSACASTSHAIALAQDWIHAGRCSRVIVLSADDITTDNLFGWFGAGFLASGAAATDENTEQAALPFDRRRHGLIVGMGAAALVVERAETARERGIRPICEVLSAVTANSAFHGTRLDVNHIGQIMETLVSQAEQQAGIDRHEIAPKTVFVSHETYTPARGGSASAEIFALRKVFGDAADQIVIANTKGFTGHAMATGIEEVLAVKSLETGYVPPIPNFKEIDPELGALNLSRGGSYPVEYALRLGAGFGSQISMALLRWVKSPTGVRPAPTALGYQQRIADTNTWSAWLEKITGHSSPEVEIVRRTLRVRDQGAAARVAAAAESTAKTAPPPPAQLAAASAPVAVVDATPTVKPVAETAVAPPAVVTARPIDPVREQVLALVSEKTGNPVDMLDVDLDLEADLGVDTVKQAEVFASIREAYNIPREDNLRLREFPTLSHVIKFVYDRRPDLHTAITVPSQPEPVITAASAPVQVAASVEDPVKERILALVVEKTGYPKDMLDLDLDLEADLGVDTVKQAELFAAVRDIYGIARDENRKLRDYPTLSHVIRFVYEQRPDLKEPQPAATATAKPVSEPVAAMVAAQPATPVGITDAVRERILDLVVEKTGYPKDMLDLDLDLEADLGVDTVKQAELFAAVREIYGIARDENRKLRDYPTLSHVIRFVYEQRPDLAAPTVAPTTPTQSVAMPIAAPDATAFDAITNTVLDIVAEKTGYPKDMLDLDLDLEADLGVDTVKQAEMFAAVRAAYNIPRDENLKLRDFPTLAHVIRFARERAGSLYSSQPSASQSGVEATATAAPLPIAAGFDAAERIPRRIPVPVLRPPVPLCKPTGVALKDGSRVVLMPDAGGVADVLTTKLQALGVEVLHLEPQANAKTLADKLKERSAGGPIQGVYWLPALDSEGELSNLDLATWRDALRVRVKSLYMTVKALCEQVGSAGGFLVSATCLGGQHGYDTAGATFPLGGAVVGFTKGFKRERADATAKAVDFETGSDPAEIADALIAETLNDPGAVEIGYENGLRWTVGLQEQPVADGQPGMAFSKDTVFLVTGAAGSIVSAITADLAAASGGVFYLLDIVPEPDPENKDIKRFGTDKEGLKRDLAARFKAAGKRVTPAMIEKELASLERAHAAQSAIDAVKAAGGTAYYFSVNLTDANAVSAVVEQVRGRHGRIDVLLHAAGLERSHFLPDKDPKEFDLVFDVKADGWFNLLKAIGDMPLGATVAFSSVAGRFGNAGQCDYSAANDLLCKITSSFRTTRPETRGIVIDWTAWGGIGMATRGSIPKMMELAGIDMLPPDAGVPFIRRELTSGRTSGEIVVANRLGILLQEFDSTGGLDVEALQRSREHLPAPGPMVGNITGLGIYSGLRMETTLTPSAQPFLNDHRIDGTPVLPGVMGIEAFAEAALCVHPGWYIEAIEEVNFLAPFKFYKDEPRTVIIEAIFRPLGDRLLTDCRLIGTRTLPNQPAPQETLHFTARVRLTRQLPEAVAVAQPRVSAEAIVDAAHIYRIYFHGPAYQVLERAWWDGEHIIGEMAASLPENHRPADLPTLVVPRLIELCFQTAGIWEMGTTSHMGLPSHINQVSPSNGHSKREGRLYAIVTPHPEQGSFDAEVVDANGSVYIRLNGYSTAALPVGLDAESLKPLQAVFMPQTAVASAD